MKITNVQKLLDLAEKHSFDVFAYDGIEGPDSAIVVLGDHDSIENLKVYVDQLEEFHVERPDRFVRIPRCDRTFPLNGSGPVLWAWLDTECAECTFTLPNDDPNQVEA
ncbi:MAG: hypothetical protein ACM3KD_11285 [Hyphomicrobiaceae bacterium]